MQFGAHIFGVGELAEPQTLVEVAQLAEDLGYHSIFVADHLIVPRGLESKYPYSGDGSFPYVPDQNWLDPMVALGFLAGLTRTIRLGTSVTVLPMRHPIVTAKQIVSADHLSGGRVIFGAGVGWMAEEFTLLGESFRDRGRRMDEYLQLIKTLWTEDNPNFVFSAFPTDRFTVELIGQFAEHGISHMLVPVFSFDASKVKQRLEMLAKNVIEPYQRGVSGSGTQSR